MTLEQKALLRQAMRDIGLAKTRLSDFDLLGTRTLLTRGYEKLEQLANEVKMNGE